VCRCTPFCLAAMTGPKVRFQARSISALARFTPAGTVSRWATLSPQSGTSRQARNHPTSWFGFVHLLYFGAFGTRMTRATASNSMCALPSWSGMSARFRAASVCSTVNATASESATTLTPLASPGMDVRTFPNRTNLNSSRASLGRPRYHGSSHMRGSMSQAIQVPLRWNAETTAPTAIPSLLTTEAPFGSAGGGGLYS